MKNHSMIFDDFFEDPTKTKALINAQEMADVKYDDGVTYPNIARIPMTVGREITKNMQTICGPAFKEVLSFARYSFADSKPPNWAHSDFNIANFLALIYLSENKDGPQGGTVCLRHKEFKFDSHPESDFHKQILLHHSNSRDEWLEEFSCPAKMNRVFVLNAKLVHAATEGYGKDRDDGRLVISVFFNLDYDNI